MKEKKPKIIYPTEFKEQCDFVAWFRDAYPGVVIMSIRNGGSRSPKESRDQMLEGLYPGAADLFIPAWLCWIEFKRVKGSVLSDHQKAFKAYVESIGQTYLLAYGFEDGKHVLNTFIESTEFPR